MAYRVLLLHVGGSPCQVDGGLLQQRSWAPPTLAAAPRSLGCRISPAGWVGVGPWQTPVAAAGRRAGCGAWTAPGGWARWTLAPDEWWCHLDGGPLVRPRPSD